MCGIALATRFGVAKDNHFKGCHVARPCRQIIRGVSRKHPTLSNVIGNVLSATHIYCNSSDTRKAKRDDRTNSRKIENGSTDVEQMQLTANDSM